MARNSPEYNELSTDILRDFTSDDNEDEKVHVNEDVEDDDDDLSTEPVEHDDQGDIDDDDDEIPVKAKQQEEPRQRQQEQQPRRDKKEEREKDPFNFAEDRQGNFIDADGNIVVPRGKPRDIFVKVKKALRTERSRNEQMSQQFITTVEASRELLSRYKELKEEKGYFESVGLSVDEAKQAADIGALMKLDPKAGIRKVLTILHLNGTDLSDIGVKGPLDVDEVARRTLELRDAREKLTPQQEAEKTTREFLGRHPTARQYAGMLAQAKERFPHMTFDELWFELLLHAKNRRQQPLQEERQERRDPPRVIPRNSQRSTGPVVGGRKLSLQAVDPSKSFKQIADELLADVRALER